MDTPIADVMIHIDETLSRDRLAGLEQTLRAREGVVSACVPENQEHMLLVAYNPDSIAAVDLLDGISRQGVHAELVGL